MHSPASVLTRHSETEIKNFCLHYALENDIPLAFWRLPGSSVRYLILARQCRALDKSETIEELATGFMFAPFDPAKQGLYLQADYLFAFENGKVRNPESQLETDSTEWLAEKIYQQPLPQALRLKSPGSALQNNSADYLLLVEKCIAQVEKGLLEKVVPSRSRTVELPEDFDVTEAFEKLCSRYNNALVSYVSIPGTGNWMGATPEALVSVEDQKIFRTVALAGTMPYHEGINLKSIAWTQKEIEEQALVERYEISCFKKIRLREYDEHGPRTMVAGNLVHLKSDFTVDLKATNFPQLGSVMLQLLHPTSAVCGMPLEGALAFLKENEGYDREFYSGYLGPVNVNNNIDLFVNLRCMKLLENRAVLFAGAGVTVDSDPSTEYEETEMKFNTLLNVIL